MGDVVTTAVQLGEAGGVAGSLLCGTPLRTTPGARGPIARFPPGRIVAYLLELDGRPRVWVFRTLAGPAPLSAHIPGVHPHVSLLLEVRTWGRAERVRQLFAYLAREGLNPDALSDAFYLRAGYVLAGRLTAKNVLLSLLRHEQP